MITEKINIGIIGVGRIGEMHLKNIVQHFPTVAIKGLIDPMLSDNILGLFQDQEKLHLDLDEMLLDETINAVIICSPTPTHYETIKKCAKHKKHIFCEKPLSFSEQELNDIINVGKKEKVSIQVGLNRRFDRDFMLMKEKIDKGIVGDIQMIHITNHDSKPPSYKFLKSSGGMLLDLCIHDFDMIGFLSGKKIKEIYVNGGVFIEPRLEDINDIDNVLITIELDNGILCSIDSSRQTNYGYDQRVEVFGSKGSLLVENQKENLLLFSGETETKSSKIDNSFIERYKQSYIKQFEHFFDCLSSKTAPSVGPYNILLAMRSAIAGNQSIDTKQPQKVKI